MKIKGFVITQAIAKKFQGIKTPIDLCRYDAGLFFLSEQGARDYLSGVLQNVKNDIAHSRRDKDNLDPNKWLDFSVSPTEIEIDEEKMLSRGWELPSIK